MGMIMRVNSEYISHGSHIIVYVLSRLKYGTDKPGILLLFCMMYKFKYVNVSIHLRISIFRI